MSTVTFAVNGVVYNLPADTVDPTVKLSFYLRDVLDLKGTKIGCGEGGCGACSVLLSRFDSHAGKVVTVSANSCLRSLVSVHGFHVLTVEGVGSPDKPHPLQKRFQELSASQCGFCTPGFVMATLGQFAKKEKSNMADIEAALDGNLCRCTGYRPILDAGKSFAVDSDIKDQVGHQTLPPGEGLAVQAFIDSIFPAALKEVTSAASARFSGSGVTHIRATTLEEALSARQEAGSVFVAAQTSAGVYKTHITEARTIVDISNVPQLTELAVTDSGITAGAATPISAFIGQLAATAEASNGSRLQVFRALAEIISKIGNVHVRNVGTIGGNITMTRDLGFSSDLATPLCAAAATVKFAELDGTHAKITSLPLIEYLATPAPEDRVQLLVSIHVPFPHERGVLFCHRTAIRQINAHAIVNSAFSAVVTPDNTIASVTAVYGCVGEPLVKGKNAPKVLAQAKSLEGRVIDAKLAEHVAGLVVAEDFVQGDYKHSHRTRLVKAFLLKFADDLVHRGSEKRAVHTSTQSYTAASEETAPVHQPIVRPDGIHHACGTAVYTSDTKEHRETLFAQWVLSPINKGKIVSIDVASVSGQDGFVKFITSADFPKGCSNTIPQVVAAFGMPGAVTHIMANDGVIEWANQPVGLLIAKSQQRANALAAILTRHVKGEQDPTGHVTLSKVIDGGAQPVMSVPIAKGDVSAARARPDVTTIRFGSSCETQQHFYMETFAAYAVPLDNRMVVNAGTQFPMYANMAVAAAIGVSMNQVEIVQERLGGSFGAKANAVHACAVAVAAKIFNRPVKMHVERNVDMMMQGGREEKDYTHSVTFDKSGKIHAVDLVANVNVGYAVELSFFQTRVIPNAFFSTYDIPNRSGSVNLYLSHLASRAPVRSPGEIEAASLTEEIIDRVAFELGVHSQQIRDINFIKEGHGNNDKVTEHIVPEMYHKVLDDGWRARIAETERFNKAHKNVKRGAAVIAFDYHVSHFCTHTVEVNILADGSVIVYFTGVESGQGLLVKVQQAICLGLSRLLGPGTVPIDRVKSMGNSSAVLPRTLITGGSVGSESNVLAALLAVDQLVEKLQPLVEALPEDKRVWQALIGTAMARGVNLSATGHYQPPADFGYVISTIGASEVEVDVVTGEVKVLQFDISFDCAKSLNPAVDIGQAEGALIMGLGYCLLENAGVNKVTGTVEHNGTWEYKIPTVADVPQHMSINFHPNEKFGKGVMSSKASGEPPLCVAPAVCSAVRQAVISARQDRGISTFPELVTPLTPDRVALACGPL